MKILHYTLGLPPERSGGLTKYATDLMAAQSQVDEVFLLYPGRSNALSGGRSIRQRARYGRVRVYELCNPVMVPLLYGVGEPADILDDQREVGAPALQAFYDEVQPDVLHVHTWMGMPLEIVRFLKHSGVSVVYTSHDYFGLCAKVNFINERGTTCPRRTDEACTRCNAKAPSKAFLQLRNSPLALKLKSLRSLRRWMKI